MNLFRISHESYANLEGIGGLSSPGRWHQKGNRVVYLAENRSLAAWEKLMNLSSIDLLPPNLVMVEVEVPDKSIKEVPQSVLTTGWNGFPHIPTTMDYGTQFLRENKYLLLKVPSAVIMEQFNFVLNPRHTLLSSCRIVDIQPFIFDDRLTKF